MDNTMKGRNDVMLTNTVSAAEIQETNNVPQPVQPSARVINTNEQTINDESLNIVKFRKIPFWATLTSYIIGFLWVTCFVNEYQWMPQHGMITLFTATFLIWAELTMKSIPRPGKECWFWMACALAIAIGMDLPREIASSPLSADYREKEPIMEGWNYFALHCIIIYWILCRSGKLIQNKTSSMFLLDGLTGCILAPFRGIPNRIKIIVYGIKEKSLDTKSIGVSIIAMAFTLPILYKVILLLGEADYAFYSIIKNIRDFTISLDNVEDFFDRFIPGIFVSSFIFSLLSSCMIWKKPVFSAPKIKKSLEAFRSIPTIGCMCILGIFIAVYLLFFKIQGSHLTSAFMGIIPGEQTAAEFAKEGFYSLCTVMGINFGLIFAISKLCKTPICENKRLKITTLVLIGESILLAITASSKLILYIDRFGFTTLRLLSIWGILVLTYGCILTIIGLLKNKSYADKWIWGTVATFVPLCFF